MQTTPHPRESERKTKPLGAVLPSRPNLISSQVRVAKMYGDIAHGLSPVFDFYFLIDPELVQEVLVTKHGTAWESETQRSSTRTMRSMDFGKNP
jgi:hypothetical protein